MFGGFGDGLLDWTANRRSIIQPEAFRVNVTVAHQENEQLDETYALYLGSIKHSLFPLRNSDVYFGILHGNIGPNRLNSVLWKKNTKNLHVHNPMRAYVLNISFAQLI